MQTAVLEAATIRQQCQLLHLPAVAAQCTPLAEQAMRERRTHLGYLEALLQAELEEREQRLVARRLGEAHLPRLKTLDEFNFSRARRGWLYRAGRARHLYRRPRSSDIMPTSLCARFY
jgi:DNA replication protein DnaC